MRIKITKRTAVIVLLCLLLHTSNVSVGVALANQHGSGSSRPVGQAQARPQTAPVRQPHVQTRQPNFVQKPMPVPQPRKPPVSPRQPDGSNRSGSPSVRVDPSPPPRTAPPLERRIQLRVASRESWQAAADYERNALRSNASNRIEFQQALIQYKLAVSNLEQTKVSQGTQFVPGTYVPLAKSHLDAARLLFLLDRQPEGDIEVRSAESLLRDLLLNQRQDNPLSRGWLWRIYYLLGDVSLYEKNPSIALFNYQQAEALKPDFVPTSLMTKYLGDSANKQTEPLSVPPSAPPSQSDISSPTGPPSAAKPAPPPIAAQGQDISVTLYQEMERISSSRALSKAGGVVKLVAAIFEVTELTPIAAALTLAGMIVDYAVQK
jgi:hypothetical protein